MSGESSGVVVDVHGQEIHGDISSVGDTNHLQGTWLTPRAFVVKANGGWYVTYVDVGSVWTWTSATEPKTEK